MGALGLWWYHSYQAAAGACLDLSATGVMGWPAWYGWLGWHGWLARLTDLGNTCGPKRHIWLYGVKTRGYYSECHSPCKRNYGPQQGKLSPPGSGRGFQKSATRTKGRAVSLGGKKITCSVKSLCVKLDTQCTWIQPLCIQYQVFQFQWYVNPM